MSVAEMIAEVEKMTSSERRELARAIEEAERQDSQSEHNAEKPFVSFATAAAEYLGKHDFGPGDLATNKEHLKGLGRD